MEGKQPQKKENKERVYDDLEAACLVSAVNYGRETQP
jgi:hypothetical protein